MNIDERLEALKQTVDQLAGMVPNLLSATKENTANIARLASRAEAHGRRRDELEDR